MSAALRAQTDFKLAEIASNLKRVSIAESQLKSAVEQISYFDLGPTAQDPQPTLQCDPTAFFALDAASNVRDERATVAFLLSATKGQFEEVKRHSTASASAEFAGFALKGSYDTALAVAQREAAAQKFVQSSSIYSNFLAQSLSSNAAELYSQCLSIEAKSKRGLRIWLAKREGRYLTLNIYWAGNGSAVEGRLDRPAALDNLTLISMPDKFISGVPQVIVVSKKDPAVDGYLGLSVEGQEASYITVAEPEAVAMETKQVVKGLRVTASSSTQSSSVCSPGIAESCIFPQRRGGFLIPGSGRLVDFTRTSGVSYSFVVDTPGRICVRLMASPQSCQNIESGTGTLVAEERFPAEAASGDGPK